MAPYRPALMRVDPTQAAIPEVCPLRANETSATSETEHPKTANSPQTINPSVLGCHGLDGVRPRPDFAVFVAALPEIMTPMTSNRTACLCRYTRTLLSVTTSGSPTPDLFPRRSSEQDNRNTEALSPKAFTATRMMMKGGKCQADLLG